METKRRALHAGLLEGLAFLATILGCVYFAWWLYPNDLFGFAIGGAGLFLIAGLVFAFHGRCPVCRGIFTRKVLRKWYSHTGTRTENGRATSVKIYKGDFLCFRCGHRWTDFM
ncbi:MAG TPA: hypothetical protein PK668_02265 [Myxococcota bacterium]|nr:hypothetical protein [Myxococcota bacterium]HRY94607.1 hypothetical protein [Myxococcota bacterium]HSA20237.1 hypothetical protein [Myxococcota bacterium]